MSKPLFSRPALQWCLLTGFGGCQPARGLSISLRIILAQPVFARGQAVWPGSVSREAGWGGIRLRAGPPIHRLFLAGHTGAGIAGWHSGQAPARVHSGVRKFYILGEQGMPPGPAHGYTHAYIYAHTRTCVRISTCPGCPFARLACWGLLHRAWPVSAIPAQPQFSGSVELLVPASIGLETSWGPITQGPD